MNELKRDLKAVSKSLNQLRRKTEQMAKSLDKLEKTRPAKKAKAKRVVKAKASKRGVAKKRRDIYLDMHSSLFEASEPLFSLIMPNYIHSNIN